MKKIIFAVAMLTATISKGQDCSQVVDTIFDNITGEATITMKEPIIKEKGYVNLVIGYKNTLIFSINGNAYTACIEDNSAVNILFEDGSRFATVTNNKFNCEGRAAIFIGGIFRNKELLKQLCTKKISAIRVETMRSPIEIFFNEDDADIFHQTINCLYGTK